MKRLLSLLVAVLFLSSVCISALASPVGYFLPEYKTSNIQTEASQDFETAISTKYGATLQDSYGFKWQRPAEHVYPYLTDSYPFNRGGDGSKYLVLQTVDKAAKYIAPFYDARATSDGEKIHYSFDVLIKDFDSTKQIRSIWRSFNAYWETHVVFGTDGKLKFNNDTVSYSYSLNRWYRFDIVIHLDHGWGNNQGTHDTSYYMDGKLLYTRQNSGNYQVNGSEKFYAPSGLRFDVGASSGTGESSMYIDNLSAKIYASGDSPVITPEKRAYTGFDVAPAACDSYGFTGDGTSTVIDYTLTSGTFGKETADSSMKVTTDLAVSSAAAPGQTATDVYTVAFDKLKSRNTLAEGEQLKLSMSYAFKKHTPHGSGADELLLCNSSGEVSLFEISREGVFTAQSSSDSFTFSQERWYNIDTIITAGAANTMQYTVYVNGIEVIIATADASAISTIDGICPERLVIRSAQENGKTSTTYFDDMYVEYFKGTSEDTATANSPVTNANVDLTENGKIFVPAGYNAANLLSDTNGGEVIVLRGGAKVTSGTAENTLVATKGIMPVFGYAFQKLKFLVPTYVLSDGSADITAVVESNQDEPLDLTLVAAVYKDSKVHSIKTASETCQTGNTSLNLTGVPCPDGGYITVFAVEGWNNKYPVFDDQVYKITSGGMALATPEMTVPSDADGIFKVSDFNYDELSVSVKGSIGTGGVKTGVLYAAPKNMDIQAASDGNLPIFAIPFVTDENGRFIIDIKFSQAGTAFGYGEFNIYVFSRSLSSPLSDGFRYLSPQQILDEKEATILSAVKSSSTWQGLREVVMGVDDDGNGVNDNFTYINPSLTDYDQLNDKENFFIELMKAKSGIVTFGDIKSKFEAVATSCLIAQNQTPPPTGGSSRPSYGSTTGVMAVTPQKPTTGDNTDSKTEFTDMASHWSKTYVDSLVSKGILNGYTDGTYRPQNNVTRAELAKIIVEAFDITASGSIPFADVSDDAWYANYVDAASAKGVVAGYNGRFNPNESVSRQDAALMVYRAMRSVYQFGSSEAPFADKSDIADYAINAANALYEAGVLQGDTMGSFRPLDNLTRAEIAAIIFRVADLVAIN